MLRAAALFAVRAAASTATRRIQREGRRILEAMPPTRPSVDNVGEVRKGAKPTARDYRVLESRLRRLDRTIGQVDTSLRRLRISQAVQMVWMAGLVVCPFLYQAYKNAERAPRSADS